MLGNVTIRTATLADVPDIMHLYAEDGVQDVTEVLTENLRRSLQSDADSFFLAEVDGQLAGLLPVHLVPLPYHHGYNSMMVCSFIVAKQHRRKGIGARLFQVAEQFASEMNCASTIAVSGNRRRDEAHKFYRSIGFEHMCEEGVICPKGVTAFAKIVPGSYLDEHKKQRAANNHKRAVDKHKSPSRAIR